MYKRAEGTVTQACKDWEETFNFLTDMVTVHDDDFNIIRANPAAIAMLGTSLYGTRKVQPYQITAGTSTRGEVD